MLILSEVRLRLVLSVVLTVFAAPLFAAVKGEEVTYKAGNTAMNGYLVYDDSIRDKRPGVLVVHDWWGHGEFVRGQARKLAERGYVTLAVDLYGDGKQAPDPDTAGELAHSLFDHPEIWMERFDAAHALLGKQPMVDAERIAAVGYSLGGVTVLEAARQGRDLAAVVSYYGKLITDNPAAKGTVKAKILVLHPAEDRIFPAAQITQFKQEMDAAEAEYRVVSYPGAKHLFNRPDADEFARKFNMPVAYDAETDKRAWDQMLSFFDGILLE